MALEIRQVKRRSVIGLGVYTIAEAQRLTRIPRQRIIRWTRGYSYAVRGKTIRLLPIVGTEVAAAEFIITFADLIEVRFLDEFRKYGVSPKALRIAAQRAQELTGRLYPFSSRIFRTDGRTILAEIYRETGDKILLDLVKNQYAFEKVVSPYLYAELDFNSQEEPERWWPLGKERTVVIDPSRAFGAPIIDLAGVPTSVLNRAYKNEGSLDQVARLFQVEISEVKDAITFETKLAA
jgi:uncharacterized protein (DUF433 family)